ncbi:Protein CBG17151 [Caenorhabditis briggsae]|uniref:Protein CBG17151 n=1 Tax=Caenorhabditis briggsae TaxID=6238 RepID=A8XQN7_CAEBR|nr:Protein CBG17151 [Caenorhabditis briggsae]CAP34962.2 Protein CBG17151 [Caenorhabditis briggsae]
MTITDLSSSNLMPLQLTEEEAKTVASKNLQALVQQSCSMQAEFKKFVEKTNKSNMSEIQLLKRLFEVVAEITTAVEEGYEYQGDLDNFWKTFNDYYGRDRIENINLKKPFEELERRMQKKWFRPSVSDESSSSSQGVAPVPQKLARSSESAQREEYRKDEGFTFEMPENEDILSNFLQNGRTSKYEDEDDGRQVDEDEFSGSSDSESDDDMGPGDWINMLREIRSKEKLINLTLDSFKANLKHASIESHFIKAVRLSTRLCFRMAQLILDSKDLDAMAVQEMVKVVIKQLRESINVLAGNKARHTPIFANFTNVVRKNLDELWKVWKSVLCEMERREREKRTAPSAFNGVMDEQEVEMDDMDRFDDGMGGRIQVEGLDRCENEGPDVDIGFSDWLANTETNNHPSTSGSSQQKPRNKSSKPYSVKPTRINLKKVASNRTSNRKIPKRMEDSDANEVDYYLAMSLNLFEDPSDINSLPLEKRTLLRDLTEDARQFLDTECSQRDEVFSEDQHHEAMNKVFDKLTETVKDKLTPTVSCDEIKKELLKNGKKRDNKKAGEQWNLRKKVVPLLLTTMLKFELANQTGTEIVDMVMNFNLGAAFDIESFQPSTSPANQKFFMGKGMDEKYGGDAGVVLPINVIDGRKVKTADQIEEARAKMNKTMATVVSHFGEGCGLKTELFTGQNLKKVLGKRAVPVKTQLPQQVTSNFNPVSFMKMKKWKDVDSTDAKKTVERMRNTWRVKEQKDDLVLEDALEYQEERAEKGEKRKSEIFKIFFLTFQFSVMEKYLKGGMEKNVFWGEWRKQLIDSQNKFWEKHQKKGKEIGEEATSNFVTSLFITNLELDDESCPEQMAEIRKMWHFLQPRQQLMAHILGTVSGINAVQVYIKEAGARTPAHQENLCVASINWNIGPGECIWYMVPLAFAAKMEALLAKKQLYQYYDNWWPCKKDLKDHGISYQKIIQKKDDLVFVGVGSYHWVQAIGPCVNVSWNIAEKSVDQLLAMALYNDHTAMQSYSPDVPLESMVLDMLEKNIPTEDGQFDELTLALGARCLARCQLKFEFAKECNLVMKPRSQLRNWLDSVGVDDSNWEKFEKDLLVPICASRGTPPIRECTRKIQANAFVLETFEGVIEVRCLNQKVSYFTLKQCALINIIFQAEGFCVLLQPLHAVSHRNL